MLTVDSSIPLTNGAATLPFTEISWTSRDGDVPAGRFDGSNFRNRHYWISVAIRSQADRRIHAEPELDAGRLLPEGLVVDVGSGDARGQAELRSQSVA